MNLKSNFKLLLKLYFPKITYTAIAFKQPELKFRTKLINFHKINLLLDIGANIGYYSHCIRNMGYNGRIISFEPLTDAYTKLKKISSKDSLWESVNMALGDKDTDADINISANSVSSSFLNMLPTHIDSAPNSEYISKETVVVRKLDSIFNDYYRQNDKVFLKIDTQGYEKKILEGAEISLNQISCIQLEMSLVNLYENETLLIPMIQYLESLNFKLMLLEPGWFDPITGKLMQVDGIFFRE